MNKLLLSVFVIAFFGYQLKAQIPTDNLLCHYSFNDTFNNSGHANSPNHGQNFGATQAADRFGNLEYAIYLDGNSMVDFGDVDIMNPDVTISFWMNYDALSSGEYRIISKRTACTAGNFFDINVSSDNTGMECYSGSNNSANAAGGGSTSSGVWHHISYVVDDSQQITQKYIDGVLVSTRNWDTPMGSIDNPATLGISRSPCINGSSVFNYSGYIDEIRVYTRPLNSIEIAALYTEPNPFSAVHIPDANFKTYLLGNASINTNGDTEIQYAEAIAFNGQIVANDLGISNLTGIEAFLNLTRLWCPDNSISSIDVSANIALTEIAVHRNQLTTLDVSANIALTELHCNQNQLTSLNVSSNTLLSRFYCYQNQLTELDISSNVNLTELGCNENQLTSLNASSNTALTLLYCFDNVLASLNVANENNNNITSNFFKAAMNADLTCITVDNVDYSAANWTSIDNQTGFSLSCEAQMCSDIVDIPDANFKNYLVGNTMINTNGDLEIQCGEASTYAGSLICNELGISDMTGIEAFINIISLRCSENNINHLDLSYNLELQELRCEENNISSLDLSNNVDLQGELFIRSNGLTSVVLPSNSGISELWASGNGLLSGIDLTGQTDLEMVRFINCGNLTSLELSTNTSLVNLSLNQTSSLASLDISNNSNLETISVAFSGISSLDISNNPNVYIVQVNNNDLTELVMSNGNNMSFAPGNFNALDNPLLTCIEVDNVLFANTVWSTDVDSGASFSTDCASSTVLVSSITVEGQGGVSTISTSGGTLQMEATILPLNASDPSVIWNVVDGTGSATVDLTSGLLTAMSDGTVIVGAAAIDGSGVFGTTVITISNQSVGINEVDDVSIQLYPNPTHGSVTIKSVSAIDEIVIVNITGKSFELSLEENQLNLSHLPVGLYNIRIQTNNGLSHHRIFKE